MAKRLYQQKLDNINCWVEITNYYWHSLRGDIHNNTDFWSDTLEAMTDQDWWDWVDIAPALKIQHEQHWRKYSKLDVSTEEIQRRLMLGKPVVKKSAQGHNFQAFRLLMNIKDLINDVNGTPTVDYTSQGPQEQQTMFEQMFEVK